MHSRQFYSLKLELIQTVSARKDFVNFTYQEIIDIFHNASNSFLIASIVSQNVRRCVILRHRPISEPGILSDNVGIFRTVVVEREKENVEQKSEENCEADVEDQVESHNLRCKLQTVT